MVAVLNLPFVPAFNMLGVPEAGAKLYFYEPNTTTPKTVYADDDLTIAHPNPVVADASGRFDTIFINDTELYRIVLKTSEDIEIGDIDSYSSGGDIELRADLSETTGAALIGTESGEPLDNFIENRAFAHAPSPKSYARNWAEAEDMLDDLSEMVGPAAEADTTGGQGYPLYKVWNQADNENIEGCLRWAVKQAVDGGGGRICFNPRKRFIINLSKLLIINGPNITIAAPGRNVSIGGAANLSGGLIRVAADNVIIRWIEEFQYPGLYYTDDASYEVDLLYIQPTTAERVWIDSCTFTEPSDGALDMYASNYDETDLEMHITISRCRFRRCDKCSTSGSGILAIEPEPSWAANALDEASRINILWYRNHFEGIAQRSPRVSTFAFAHTVNNIYDMSPYHRDDGTAVLNYAGWALNGGKIYTQGDYLRLAAPAEGTEPMGIYAHTDAWDDTTNLGPGAVRNNGSVAEGVEIVEANSDKVVAPSYLLSVEEVPAAGALRDAWADTIRHEAGAEISYASTGMLYQFVPEAEAEAAGLWADGYDVRRVSGGYMVRASADPLPALDFALTNPLISVQRGGTRTIAGGVLDITGIDSSFFVVVGEGSAADDLVDITSDDGIVDGQIIYIRPSSSGTITVKTTGNIRIAEDIALDSSGKVLALVWDTGTNEWGVLGDYTQGVTTTLASGTYTPTLTAVANCSALSVLSARYQRLGSSVVVSGMLGGTFAGGTALIGVEPPVASDFSNAGDASGACTNGVISGEASADIANNRIELQITPTAAGGFAGLSFICQYEVK